MVQTCHNNQYMNRPKRRSNTIIARDCDICQTEYLADVRYLNRGQGKTCGRKCGAILMGRLSKIVREPNTTCGLCGKPIWRSSRALDTTTMSFCDIACQLEAISKGILRTGPAPRNNSSDKIKETAYERNVRLWLSGDNDCTIGRSTSTGLPRETKSFVKRYLLQTRGERCELCGFTVVNSATGNTVIQMDHTDGNCFNNDPDNLRLLCPNCHSMTPTYGSLNKGSGRAHRRRAAKLS